MEGIYSTRPQMAEPGITILKLNNPALLETATREKGQLVVDSELLQKIEAEQAATIAELQKISPDIQILLRYRLVLNGLAIVAPPETFDKIKGLSNVTFSEKAAGFAQPKLQVSDKKSLVGDKTSVKFIGAEAAYAQNIQGQGLRVGVIDTGVDYTHKMFLGEGTVEAYKANEPGKANTAFPNKKVVGGIDLVGTDYNPASPIFANRIPIPDLNPIDEAGHGTHVAGTVAGIGDGVNTYSGVAPAADLYAIKVFGAKGGTSDEVVIAALEYAADPDGDLSFKNQLDVVNLSLGSNYGNPHIMYSHAVKNLVRGGTVVVASAGNSGDKSYITGAPAISEDAISVASSIDNMAQNILFPTVEFKLGEESLIAEAVESDLTKKLATIDELKGEIIALGLGDADFDPAQKERIKGKIALLDRGAVSFADKIRRAQEAGAIAVIIANNSDEDPIVMGGEGHFDIPAVMIGKADASKVKTKLQNMSVTVDLKTTLQLEKSWLVDTISPFSSRGPRSDDGLIKPEISSPGTNIISAKMGGGDEGVSMSGTSMAGPHIAGVMALLKQKFAGATAYELKSLLLGRAKVISDKNKKQYPVSRQGAGRVQVAASLEAKFVSQPATLSFGITDIEKQKTLSLKLSLKNLSAQAQILVPEWQGSSALQVRSEQVILAPGQTKIVTVMAQINAALMKEANEELDGYLKFSSGQDPAVFTQIPVLVVARKISQVNAKSLKVFSTSAADGAGSAAELVLQNTGVNPGTAHVFNLLGVDSRKKENKPDYAHNRNCDLQSAGYRILDREGVRVLQVAVKLYEGITTWHTCEVNVQIDANGDNLADQEIAGTTMESLPGMAGGDKFGSLLLDGNQARKLRQRYELNPLKPENYESAVVDLREMKVFPGETLAVVEAELSKLTVAPTGELNIKVSTTHQDYGVIEMDDYLNNQAESWHKISVNPMAQSFSDLPEELQVKGGESLTLSLKKGYGTGEMILYAPQNRSVKDVLLEDNQSQVIPITYGAQ